MVFGKAFKLFLYIFVMDFPFSIWASETFQYKCPATDSLIYPCNCLRESNKGLHIRCENTNLASLSIAVANIAHLKFPIENLTIFQGNFERLFGNIFYNSSIRILQIEETPLKLFDEYLYYGINNTLQELHVIKSKLQEFPALAFKVLGNLLVLNIDNHQIQKLENNSFFDSAISRHLEQLYITNGYIDELAVETFLPLHKLKILDLHGNKLVGLKRGQFKNLHNVDVLDLSYNNISKVDAQHMSDLIKLGWCNISHNSLTELARGTFSRRSAVKVINLAFNKISRLDANSFQGLRLLRRLYINDNSISDVGRGTFGSILKIGTIDLARNKLKKIEYQMFAQLNYVEIIDLAENNITKIEKQSFKDIYQAKINISYNRIEKIEKYAFENCANLTVLDLSHNLLRNISEDAFDAISFATELQYSYNLLTDISLIGIHNMAGLKILNVSHNEIEKIPKNTFPPLYELHTVDVSYNNLSIIANSVFQPLFSLRYLFLQHNLMENVGTAALNTIPTVLHLDLSYNKLKIIAKRAFEKLTSLRLLNLKNNMIESFFEIPLSLNHLDLRINWLQEIPKGIWPTMNSLISLDLSGNRVGDSLRSYSFSGLLTLQTLKINDNGITQIPYDALLDLPTLQYLHLENNNVTRLSKHAFGKLPVLFELNLYKNNINNISIQAFDGLLQLLKLNLSSNAIRYLPNGAFLGLVSLQNLDLSYNLLEKLDNKSNGVLDDCLSLESVNLSHNKISFINRKTFPSNPYIPYKLYEVDLSHNKMYTVTYDLTFGMKNVRKLNLSSNLISEIRKGVLENLTHLNALDLSANFLTDLCSENDIFKLPISLKEIYLQYNKITCLPFQELSLLKNLTKTDLRSNQLEKFSIQLTDQIKNGVQVFLKDNPLHCDCHIRPLKHFLDSLPILPKELANIECVTPLKISKFISEISDDQLYCNDTEALQFSEDAYDILPDIRFRGITFASGWLTVEWYVTSNRDVADFYISLSNEKNVIFFDKHVAYIIRSVKVPGSLISKALAESENIKLCALAKDSNGVIRRWFKSQCIQLPAEFQHTIRKYSKGHNGIFVVVTKNSQPENVITSDYKEVTSCSKHMQKFCMLFFLLSITFFV